MESPACRKYSVSDLLLLYCAMKRYHKETKEILMLALPSVICLAVTMNTFYQMKPDRYVNRKLYRDVTGEQNRQAVKEALKDDGYYRTEQMGSDDEKCSRFKPDLGCEQNITSIYSSAYNRTIRHSVRRHSDWKNRSAMG